MTSGDGSSHDKANTNSLRASRLLDRILTDRPNRLVTCERRLDWQYDAATTVLLQRAAIARSGRDRWGGSFYWIGAELSTDISVAFMTARLTGKTWRRLPR